jgi:Swt1-like HEPN
MRNRGVLDKIKAFGMTNHMVTEDLQRIGKLHSIDLGHLSAPTQEDVYYPQFDAAVRAEAAQMSKHYETFYCLEKSIRAFVSNIIEEAERTDAWWASARVPVNIKTEVAARIRREIDTGMTRRSTNELEYTTLGELTNIITSNWDIFGGSLSSEKAVTRVMSSLNSLRGPVAHCSPLAEDEVVRLQLAVRDWFRLME